MVVVNKIIHRFIRNRTDYEEGGALYNQIIPYNVQAYSYKLKENGDPSNPDDYIIAYVLGTGSSTYMEIANGQGKDSEGESLPALSKEIFVTSKEELDILFDEKVTHLKELTSEEAILRKGEIVQYIGETIPDYTEGYFYKAGINSGGYVINLDGSRLTGISNVTIDQEKLREALESYGLNLPLDFQADHTHYWTCVSSMGGSSLCIGTEVLNDVWGITWEGTPEYATPDLFTIIDIEEEPGYGYWTRIDVQPSSGSGCGYLAMWDCATGLPLSDSLPNFYQYNEGDYFVVGNTVIPSDANTTIEQIYGEGLSDLAVDITVLETKLSELIDTTLSFYYNNENEWVLNDEVVDITEYGVTYEGTPEAGNRIDVVYTAAVYNYKPYGMVYERGVASRVIETESISVNNTYMFNGVEWVLQASGKVDDVLVNGVSVVVDKIANIDLTDATYSQKGISRFATEEEIVLGTSESAAVNALQLNKAIDKEAKARLITDESIALTKLQDYLYMYESIASDMTYEEAIQYFEENFHNRENVLTSFIPYGACSSIRSGNFYGRNYDWYYNTNTTFVVYDKAQKDKYEFLGVAQSVLDEIDFDSEETILKLRLIPYLILDGVNEHSVFCNTNVVPTGDLGITTGTHADLEGDYICQIMLPKYVLDHFTTATDAVNWIRDEAKIFAPRNATTQLELHFMVGDPNHTYIVEFVHNEAVIFEVTNSKQEVMTNFYRYNASFDVNGHIDFNSVTNYGAGLERYNLLVDAYDSVDSVESMRNCIDLAQYTKAYTEIYTDPVARIVNPNTWKTEWAHDYSDSTILPHPMDLHANSPLSDYEYSGIFDVLYNMYQIRSRETGTTWQTVHSSVYDIERKELYLKVQEGNKQYHFVYPTTPRILQNIDEEVARASTAEQEIKESIVWEAGEGEGSVITKINAKEDVGGSAKGAFAVSEGWGTVASGESSHTEGRMTMVIHAADCAHAEGNGTTAGGRASHTEGVGTVTSNMAEHAEGHYNKTNQATTVFGDAGNTLSSIGIGSGNLEIDQGRKNAVEVMQNGDTYLIGVGGYDGTNFDEADTIQDIINAKVSDVQVNGTTVVVDNIANIEPTASDVAYTNEQYPSMHTLQDAMDRLLYITPSVSISGGGTYEIGATRATTTLTWSWNKTIVSQSLNQGIGSLDPTLRTYTYNTPITSNTTFTISGTDGTTSKSASTTVSFSPKRYWGVSVNTSLTDEQILALSSELSTSRTQTRTFDCSGGKYFYFVIRTSYCNGISFKVNGLAFTDMDLETRNVVNAQGYSAEYNIYRVHNIQTGSAIEVQVL